MRKKNFKGRCEKRKLPKCEEVCRTYDAIQYTYAEVLSGARDIKSFRAKLLTGYELNYLHSRGIMLYDKYGSVIINTQEENKENRRLQQC